MPPEESVVLVEGPWSHREVTANGARFHLAEHGPADGPLVLLLHGFPEFWWSWRHQLTALGDAGFRVVAPDLRGYGGSDKPPRGYDAYTLSSDVAGMIRALGATDACVVGSDWGGLLAWAVATLHPSIVRSVGVIGMPHPLRLREALLRDPAQIRASSYIAMFQLPKAPEARLVRDDAAYVEKLLRRWGGPGFPDAETASRCRAAMQIPGVAHSSMEWYRWAVRSQTRPSGRQFLRLMGAGVSAPVLQVHGVLDSCLLPSTADGSAAYARGGHTMRMLHGVGHFPHEEAPEVVNDLLVSHARPCALGRPVPVGSPAAVEPVAEEALPPDAAVALARSLLAAGRAFAAHEVFEAVWKAAPAPERELWQGLAQVCVGLTHLQRGNRVGAARLLRRGAGLLAGRAPAYDVDVAQVARDALALAAQVDAGGGEAALAL